MQDLKCFKMT